MALITCPECGGKVSDQAPACIHCGFPLGEYVAQLNDGSPRYDLYVHIPTDTSDEELEIVERILKELLDMSWSDIYDIKHNAVEKVAQNLTVEQASKVMGPFAAYGMGYSIYAREHDGKEIFYSSMLDGYSPEHEVKQDHYDGPIIDEAQKVEKERPAAASYASAASASSEEGTGPKCPTCGSTNVQKINQAGRLVSTAVWGVSSKKMAKTYKCNKCGHTW